MRPIMVLPVMRLKGLTLATATAFAVAVPPAGAQSTAPVQFRPHDIAQFPGGYAVQVADFNNDGRLDVSANKFPRFLATVVAWYENPTGERHVIVTGQPLESVDGVPLNVSRIWGRTKHDNERRPSVERPEA